MQLGGGQGAAHGAVTYGGGQGSHRARGRWTQFAGWQTSQSDTHSDVSLLFHMGYKEHVMLTGVPPQRKHFREPMSHYELMGGDQVLLHKC